LPTDQSRVVAHGPRAAQRPRKASMTRGPDPLRVATDFLQERLAEGPVLVSELEAAARAAGLLGNGQRITHAKPWAINGGRRIELHRDWAVFELAEPRIAQEPGAGRRRLKPAMRGRPDHVSVAAEFLRKELAKGAVLVLVR
jgi:hypothetical protein